MTIYERDASLDARREGYGLTLTFNPSGVLAQLGILEQLALDDCPSRSHYLLDAASGGRIRGYFGNDFAPSPDAGLGQRGNLRVPRQRVRELLVGQLESTRIHWDHKLTGIVAAAADDDHETVLTLQFANGVSVEADVLIAADGVRSAVVQLWIPKAPPPRSLGVRIILGITIAATAFSTENNDHDNDITNHELLRERGFYTLAEGMRLFVMPYQGSALGRSLVPGESVRYMWQLSFAVPGEEKDNDSSRNFKTPEQLQSEALQWTQGWHEPVQSLIRSTDSQDVWGTLLRDRDPVELQKHLLAVNNQNNSAVLIAGDALHAMSPFKGQGANRCLHDGLILAKWLTQSRGSSGSKQNHCSRAAAVKNVQREMVQRTAPVVLASRASAQYWHSPEALRGPHKFAGVERDDDMDILLNELERRNITAETKDLDHQIRCVIQRLGIGQQENWTITRNANGSRPTSPQPLPLNGTTLSPPVEASATLSSSCSASFAAQAFEAASTGALERLRQLAWGNEDTSSLIRRVVDPVTGGTCLHLAAAAGHSATVHWLVTQAGCDCRGKDGSGRTALDLVANRKEHAAVWELLNRLQNTSDSETSSSVQRVDQG